MFTSGQSILASMIFSILTFSVSIPSAIKVFNWLASMYKGSISLATPMCYALAFIFLFGIGGLTGLFLGSLGVNMHLHNTYFLVSHFHYVMFGGTVIAFLGGLHYWWPKMTGRMFSDFWGRIAVMLIFVGFNLTFFPQFLMGTHGMTRRYDDYSFIIANNPEIALYNLISSLGSFLLAFGFCIIPCYLIASLFTGRKAPANPWGGATLEWQCSSPPPFDNFPEQPIVDDPYDFSRIKYDEKTDGYVRVEV
jgi:cytochrome c oxidase subunit 1